MRAASREKNHTPECPSGALTYVRQFVSGNCEIQGRGGSDFARKPRNRKGVTPTHAHPSNDSTQSGRGTCFCTTSTGYRQCKKVRSHQLCHMTWCGNGSGIASEGFMDIHACSANNVSIRQNEAFHAHRWVAERCWQARHLQISAIRRN